MQKPSGQLCVLHSTLAKSTPTTGIRGAGGGDACS